MDDQHHSNVSPIVNESGIPRKSVSKVFKIGKVSKSSRSIDNTIHGVIRNHGYTAVLLFAIASVLIFGFRTTLKLFFNIDIPEMTFSVSSITMPSGQTDPNQRLTLDNNIINQNQSYHVILSE